MQTDLQTQLGKQIRQYRQARGLTIEELAFRAHLHPSYLGDIERGDRNPSLLNLKKIAESLGRPVKDLFRNSNAPSIAREKQPEYLSPSMDRVLTALIKSLRRNSAKDQAYILKSAKALSLKLKKSH